MIGEKSPSASSRGRKNKPFAIYESNLFPKKMCPKEKLFHQSLSDPEEAEYPTPAHSSHAVPSYQKGEEGDGEGGGREVQDGGHMYTHG